MEALESILNEIARLEAERDFGNIAPEQSELLTILNFCYDLISRTKLARAEQVKQPEEMMEPGFDDEYVDKYGLAANYLADFAFALVARKGEVSIRELTKYLLSVAKIEKQLTQVKFAESIGIRQATISEYITGKQSMTADNIDKIINRILQND
jgi:predicted XRE-type DNA-binding protein